MVPEESSQQPATARLREARVEHHSVADIRGSAAIFCGISKRKQAGATSLKVDREWNRWREREEREREKERERMDPKKI